MRNVLDGLEIFAELCESIMVLGLFVAVICHSMRLRDLEKK